MDFSGQNILAIADLLKQGEPESDSDDDMKPDASGVGALGPANIGPAKQQSQTPSTKGNTTDSRDIWEQEEVPEGAEYENIYDPRPQPQYEIVYKQAVTSEDMFLQMGNKTPLTSSCEDMLVKIHLPDTKLSDVELDVKTKFLDCRTPQYKLGLHLPHPVDHKSGRAQWNASTSALHVTLRLTRDLDIFNF